MSNPARKAAQDHGTELWRAASAIVIRRRTGGRAILLDRHTMPQLVLDDFNLEIAERRMCVAALELAGSIGVAAELLGITRHALKRRIIKLRIEWPRRSTAPGET